METYMTANDVAAFIKLSLTSVRRLTMNKQIPNYKINRSVRYKLNEIETWLESRKQAVIADTAKTEGGNV
jgi:excisionase family DNA binding protein